MNFSSAPRLSALYSSLLKHINTILSSLPIIQFLDNRYSSTPGQSTLLFLLLLTLFNILITPTPFIARILSFYYPAIRTIRTLKSTSLVQYHRWATYWIIFISVEFMFDGLLRMIVGYLPYFELWKIGFFVTMYHPKIDKAYVFYLKVVKVGLKRIRKMQKEKEGRKEERKASLEIQNIQIGQVRKYSDGSVRSS